MDPVSVIWKCTLKWYLMRVCASCVPLIKRLNLYEFAPFGLGCKLSVLERPRVVGTFFGGYV